MICSTSRGRPMETFYKLFGSLLISLRPNGRLISLLCPLFPGRQRAHAGGPRERTNRYRGWVDSYAADHGIPIEGPKKACARSTWLLPFSGCVGRTSSASITSCAAWRPGPPSAPFSPAIPWNPDGSPEKPLYSFLLLHPRSTVLVPLHGSFLPFQIMLSQRPFLYRARTDVAAASATARAMPFWGSCSRLHASMRRSSSVLLD